MWMMSGLSYMSCHPAKTITTPHQMRRTGWGNRTGTALRFLDDSTLTRSLAKVLNRWMWVRPPDCGRRLAHYITNERKQAGQTVCVGTAGVEPATSRL